MTLYGRPMLFYVFILEVKYVPQCYILRVFMIIICNLCQSQKCSLINGPHKYIEWDKINLSMLISSVYRIRLYKIIQLSTHSDFCGAQNCDPES